MQDAKPKIYNRETPKTQQSCLNKFTREGVGVRVRGSRFFGVLNDTLGVGWGEGISKLTLIYVKIHKWGFLGTPS